MTELLRRQLVRAQRHLQRADARASSHDVRMALDAVCRAIGALDLPNEEPAELECRRLSRPFPIVDAEPTLVPMGRRSSFVKAAE
jgi:hypothetical protein